MRWRTRRWGSVSLAMLPLERSTRGRVLRGPGARADRRLGRAPWQRDAGARRARPRPPLCLHAPMAVVPGHRGGRRSRTARVGMERANAPGTRPRGLRGMRYSRPWTPATTRILTRSRPGSRPDSTRSPATHSADSTLEVSDIVQLTRELVGRAEGWCQGRVVSALEGGYVPERVASACVAHLRALA